MKPEEVEALAERLAKHNRWLRGDLKTFPHHDAYAATQYGLDLDTAVALLRGMAREWRAAGLSGR